MIALAGIAIAIYVALVAVIYLAQDRLLYFPSTESPERMRATAPDLRAVRLTTDDGLDLLAWWRPPAVAAGWTLALFHGNAGHIGHRLEKVRPHLVAGLGVLLVEYRGYGGNAGRPSENGFHADARAALAFLDGLGVPRARLALYGESLGTGVAVRLAAEAAGAGGPVGAVLLEAPYSSIADVAQHHYPWLPARWLTRDRFAAIERVAVIGAPLLVLHGARDTIVPLPFGQRLFAAAREPKELVVLPDGGHNDLDARSLARQVHRFLSRWTPAG